MIHVIDLHFQGLSDNIAAFLVETNSGPILIETGPHSTLPHLLAGIENAGYRTEDIQHVFLSHIHLDHAGAAWWFAEQGASIYVHPLGAKHLAAPERLMESARRIYQDQMDRLWGEMRAIPAAQLVQVEHEARFPIGEQTLIAWHTPGHAVHHITWQLDRIVFTGDVAGVSINHGLVVPPCPPPDINIEDWHQSTQLLRTLGAETFYLTHFGPVTDTEKHLDQLDATLSNWATWMRPHYEAGTASEDITPLFQEMVKQELLQSGVSSEGVAQYEAANPSWMSVAGLLRYWRKKER